MCKRHYEKWRKAHGRLGEAKESIQQAHFRTVVLQFRGEECLIWPFGRDKDGYGRVNYQGLMMPAGRAACIEMNGPPPTPKHHAAHNCGKGTSGCVNPLHVRWATPKENAADKELHGTNLGRFPPEAIAARWPTMLTPDEVQRIRLDPRRGSAIARDYGVQQSTINNIKKRRIWKALPWPGEVRSGH